MQSEPSLPWDVDASALRVLLGLPEGHPIRTLTTRREFGGYTGEKCVVERSAESRVLLKKTTSAWARQEETAYQALASVNAPIVHCYGTLPITDAEALSGLSRRSIVRLSAKEERRISWLPGFFIA